MGKTIKGNNIFLLLFFIFIVISFATMPTVFSEEKKDSEKKEKTIVAKVNGKPIYKVQLTPYIERLLKKIKKYGGGRKETPELIKHLQKKAIDELIETELLYQESKKLHITDMEEKIKEKKNKMKSRYKAEEHFVNMLKAKNFTENDLKESIKKSIYIDEYLKKQGIWNPEVPEAEIKGFYNKNKNNFKREEYIKARHILIIVDEGAKPEEHEKARKKAEKIRQEIIGGKDFTEMAKEHSEDGRASVGGDLDYIKRGYMPAEFDKVAFALKKDKISEVVQTKHGYHIIKVVDKKPEGIAPYDEIRDFIRKYLQDRIAKKKLATQIEELKKKAKIEIFIN